MRNQENYTNNNGTSGTKERERRRKRISESRYNKGYEKVNIFQIT